MEMKQYYTVEIVQLLEAALLKPVTVFLPTHSVSEIKNYLKLINMFDLDFSNFRSPSETLQCSHLQLLFHIGHTQSSVFFIGKCKCSGTFRFQRLYYVQHVFWFLKDMLENLLKDTFILNIPLLYAQGRHYSKVVIYTYFTKNHKIL